MLPLSTEPVEHLAEARKLNPNPYVELFEIQIDAVHSIWCTSHPTIVWKNTKWENYPLTFSGYNVQSTGEQSRPKLQIANPNAIFSSFIAVNAFNKATVKRYMVFRDDLVSDTPIYILNKWKVSRVASLTKDSVTLELRSILDGVRYTLPARQYMSPDFPSTTMG
jgi:lambda family phage minor tail protein L